MANETIRFMERVTHLEITSGAKVVIDLNDLRATYGDNFNTLFLTNTDTGDNIEVYLDGKKVKYITANNGTFSFDWESGVIYNFLILENVGAGTIAADDVKITVGRTGRT